MCSISGSNCGIILPPAFAASMVAGPSTSSVLNVLSPSILALDCVVYTSILAVGCVVLWGMQRAVLWGMQRAVLWGCVVYTSELAVDTGRNIHHKSMRGMSCFYCVLRIWLRGLSFQPLHYGAALARVTLDFVCCAQHATHAVHAFGRDAGGAWI